LSTRFFVHVSIFVFPIVCTLASVITSNTDGIVSLISIEFSSVNDSISILTLNELGLIVGSILLCAVRIIS
jgi:hypothetical protein